MNSSRILVSLLLFLCSGMLKAITQSKIQQTKPITYQEIGDSYISSFGIVEMEKPSEYDKSKKALDLTIPVLSENEKRHISFSLMAHHEKTIAVQEDSLIANALRITLADLDAYSSQGKDSTRTVMNEISNTDTIFGETGLAYALAHPLNAALTEKRQAIIKELVENEQLFNQVDTLLRHAKDAESGFFSFWRKDDPVSEKLFKDLYFVKAGFNQFNNNPYALEALVRAGNLGTCFKITGDFIGMVAFNYLMAKMAKNMAERNGFMDPALIKVSWKDSFINTCSTIKSMIDPRDYYDAIVNVDANLAKVAQAQNKVMTVDEKNIAKKVVYGFTGFKAVITAGIMAYKYSTVKSALKHAQQVKDSINYLQTRLIDVATIVDVSKQFCELSQKHRVLREGIFSVESLQQVMTGKSCSARFFKLLSLLQTNTFKNHASFLSLSGRVLAANKLMAEEKDQFAPFVAALGEIDACLSMAKLYKKMQHERVGYCFVEFVEQEKPYIYMKNFWNIFIHPAAVVTNSLELGHGTDASKIILTGSNTGGKSTILKAITLNLLLAHTFGLAAANECVMTPFAFFGSYLRVNDDTASGESKFKAEVLRAKMLCETIESLASDQFGFVVIDELFTGTGSANAAQAAAKVAQKLAHLPNSLYILATHFTQLTELEKDNPGLIKNYKVDVYKNEDGNLIRPFKLMPGISSNNVANDILNEQITNIDF